MNRRLKFAIISWGIAISVLLPQVSQARIEKEIKRTGVLKVGIREDSPLFGFSNEKIGYCADFANSLAENLSQKFNRPIRVDLVKSTTQNRWSLVQDGKVHVECGPNTITAQREKDYEIKFSQPFFVTATQVFVKVGATEEMLKNGTIGIIEGTTNAQEIQSVYPTEQINDTFQRRSQGISAVQLREIDGFASDGILLMGTASALEINPQKYTLVTPLINDRPLCATYGMILPGGKKNFSWHNTINSWIAQSGQGEKIWDTWFRDFLPYMEVVLNACQGNQPSNFNNPQQPSSPLQTL